MAAQAAIAQAIEASGAIVRLEPQDFMAVLGRTEAPLVVRSEGGLSSTTYQYLTSYKGLTFFTSSDAELSLPPGTLLIRASQMWMPQ